MLIEQAIFTSAETERTAGYQLAATSPGIDAADLHELQRVGAFPRFAREHRRRYIERQLSSVAQWGLLRLEDDPRGQRVQRARRTFDLYAVPCRASRGTLAVQQQPFRAC